MRKRTAMSMENSRSRDVSELLQLTLSNLGYTHERQVHYVFLIEEALLKWRNELPEDALLRYERRDTPTAAHILLTLKGEKCDPFAAVPDESEDGMSIERMIDRLLSGVGAELKYSYRRGVNRITIRLPKADIDNSLFRYSLLVLMIPIALQTLLENVASNVDALMLGFLSATDMSAVSLAAKYVSIHGFIISAMSISLSVLCSQFWGVRDRKRIENAAGIAMKFALLPSLLFFGITFIFPDAVMSMYTNDALFIAEGAKYLRILSFSFVLSPLFRIPYAVMRATGRVRRSVIYAVCGCGVNIVLNGVLIFGLFGLPAMGINGAALATVLSGALQLGFIVTDALREKSSRVSYFKAPLRNNPLMKTFLSSALPMIMQHMSWIVALNILTAAIGHMEADIVAANSLLLILFDIIASVRDGIGSAAAMLMGNILGKGRLDEAQKKSRILRQTGLYAGIGSAVILALAAYLFRFLPIELSPKAISYMDVLIVFYALNTLFAMMNAMINHGSLYPGGDSAGVLLADAIAMWLILVPLALLGPHIPFLPPLIFTGILKSQEIISFPFKYARLKKGLWLKSLVKE